jgi:hypothetical protein
MVVVKTTRANLNVPFYEKYGGVSLGKRIL